MGPKPVARRPFDPQVVARPVEVVPDDSRFWLIEGFVCFDLHALTVGDVAVWNGLVEATGCRLLAGGSEFSAASLSPGRGSLREGGGFRPPWP